MTTRTPEELEEKLHYHFKNKELLITALTHSSYANESKTPTLYNERLEFLGDSVLSVVVANYLFHHSTRPEGELSRMRASLVSEDALFQFAQEIDLGSYLRLGRGEELGGDRVPKMAVYQDSLHRMEERTGQPYDWYMDLDITSPLRTEQDIENAFAKAQEREDLQIIFSVCEARRNPWFNMFKIVGDHAEMVIESQFTGRQQAPEVYDVNASIYVIRRAFLVDNPDPILWHSKFGVSVMMDTGIIDIDSEHDYLLMEAIAQHLYAHYPEFNAVRENIRG